LKKSSPVFRRVRFLCRAVLFRCKISGSPQTEEKLKTTDLRI